MGKSKKVNYFLLSLITLFVLAVFAISIAVVVKVYKKDDGSKYDYAVLQYMNMPIDSSDIRYKSFESATKRISSIYDPQIDPCDDFYNFTCHQMTENSYMSFDEVQLDSMQIMIEKFKDYEYRRGQVPKPIRQLFTYFDACVNKSKVTNGPDIVMEKVNDFRRETGLPFPLLDGGTTFARLNETNLASAIGYLLGRYNLPTFLSSMVDTKWKNPSSGYMLFIDEATLIYDRTYYTKVEDFTAVLAEKLQKLLQNFKSDLNPDRTRQTALEIATMENRIARKYMFNESENRQFESQYNVFTTETATQSYNFIDWAQLIKSVTLMGNANVKETISKPSFEFVIMKDKFMISLMKALTNDFTPETILNYFYVRLIQNYESLLTIETVMGRQSYTTAGKYRPVVGRPRYIREPRMEIPKKFFVKADAPSLDQMNCVRNTIYNFQYANARLFVDAKYPSQEERKKLRAGIGQFVNAIIAGFRGMIDQLNWMDNTTRAGAYHKIDNLVKNIGYPDFITEDVQLTNYYRDLDIKNTDSLHQIEQKLFDFDLVNQINTIVDTSAKRNDFNGPPGLVNAWYQPELNSITFPAAILGQPFYDSSWPISINYGALGVVAGHELTHGFDDEGVQWDGTGAMAKCVIDEYTEFCPSTTPGLCIDGEQTQGENIADNGGIHAAYRAYKNHANLKGQDRALRDPVLSLLSHDQLFFMGFAQVWCDTPSMAEGSFTQLLVDPHSPSFQRVFGTIQNFPAFKNAFNCPDNKEYTPPDHCDVWVSDVSSCKFSNFSH